MLGGLKQAFRIVPRWLLVAVTLTIVVTASFLFDPRTQNDEFDQSKLRLHSKTREVLESPDSFVLYSLDPIKISPTPRASNSTDLFHDYSVLGKAEITLPEERTKLLRALYKGIVQGYELKYVASCFNPRHGIRATRQGVVVDFVICFECLSIAIYAEEETGVKTTSWGASTFNSALQRHSLPQAKH